MFSFGSSEVRRFKKEAKNFGFTPEEVRLGVELITDDNGTTEEAIYLLNVRRREINQRERQQNDARWAAWGVRSHGRS